MENPVIIEPLIIEPLIVEEAALPHAALYKEIICNVLSSHRSFYKTLPFVILRPCSSAPGNLSFIMVNKLRPNAFKFFYNMISYWLTPGQKANVVLLYAVDFKIPMVNNEVYTFCEIVVRVETGQELDLIIDHFPMIESELRLGILSSYKAASILEAKGLAQDFKPALIHECIAQLIERFPKAFNQEIITEMQYLLVTSKASFKEERTCRHLCKIIALLYLFRKGIKEGIKQKPKKRHLNIKFFQSKVGPLKKSSLSVIVALNLHDKEVFDQRHLLKAIQHFVPSAVAVENSFFVSRIRQEIGQEQISALYLEIEKSNGDRFTVHELTRLKVKLASDLKTRIESLVHPVFMPRNEEEVMRNILSLSEQIKYLSDIPQSFVSFEEQTRQDLFFTVIFVRVLREENQSLQQMFKESNTLLEYIHDRVQYAGVLRRKFKKEATVFRVKLAKEPFLRADHSIDLNLARQTVIGELTRVAGKFRDFNGGMISKQNEVLSLVRALVKDASKYKDLLLENFFYSLIPVVTRSVVEPKLLGDLFLLLLESMDHPLPKGMLSHLDFRFEDTATYAVLKSELKTIKEDMRQAIANLCLDPSKLVHSSVVVNEMHYIAYLYRGESKEQQMALINALKP